MAKPSPIKKNATSLQFTVKVEEVKGRPGIWCVDTMSPGGENYQAMFSGAEARERAVEYAELKYGFKQGRQDAT
jgi:hypothetical protein